MRRRKKKDKNQSDDENSEETITKKLTISVWIFPNDIYYVW